MAAIWAAAPPSVSALPEIEVEQPVGTGLVSGGTSSYGAVPLGSTSLLTFTIRNSGDDDLTGLALSIDGADAADFTPAQPGQAVLAPSTSTTFTVAFKPGAQGTRDAAIHLLSSDADQSPFTLNLTGSGSPQGIFTYHASDGTLTITGYNGAGGDLAIPATLDGMPVTGIGARAFQDQTTVTNVTIPDSVTSIGQEAFLGCRNLTTIGIPYSVTSIGPLPFLFCFALTTITVDAANAFYSSLDGVLFNESRTLLVQCPPAKSGPYAIPGGVTHVGDYAFFSCGALSSITIPDTVTSIGNQCFCYCRGIQSLIIPDSVTSIEGGAFRECSGLVHLSISGNITSIENSTFERCTGLASVSIPPNVTSIGWGAFNECYALTNVTIPAAVTSIGSYAFYGCTHLAFAVFEGSAPTTLGWDVFLTTASGFMVYYTSGSSGFSSPTWQGYPAVDTFPPPPQSVITGAASTITATSATVGGTVNPEGAATYARIEYGPDTNYGSSVIASLAPANSAGPLAVSTALAGLEPATTYHYRLIATNAGGTGVGEDHTFVTEQTLGDYKFTTADGQITVTDYVGPGGAVAIPGTIDGHPVTTIGTSAFAYRSDLTGVSIPAGVTTIGAYAFYDCGHLTEVTIPDGVTSIGDAAFLRCSVLAAITVSSGNPNYTSVGGVLLDRNMTSIIQCPGGRTGHYTIPEGVTSIGDYAFYECVGLTSVAIPGSVTTIGDSAFYECTGLTSASIPGSVTTIGDSAFYECTGLTSASIPGNVTNIGDKAFFRCTGLTSVVIPAGVTSIGFSTFYGCTGLARIVLPEGVASIEWAAFYGCTNLQGVFIPSTVTGIESAAFGGCSRLLFASFAGNAPTTFDSYAFSNAASGFTIYYNSGSTGFWSPFFKGYAAVGTIPPPPTPITWAARGVSASAATLDGTVNPQGFATFASFEYGTDTAYGKNAAVTLSPANGTTAQIMDATLSGLAAGQAYHYRLTATNAGGTGVGEDHTFVTERTSGDYKFTTSDGTISITGYVGVGGAVVIPGNLVGMPVTAIGNRAFVEKTTISAVTIPQGVSSIGDAAFSGCTGLTGITIPDSVTSIGYSAFYDCTGLRDATIGSGVATIGNYAFSGCTGLVGITIPGSVTSLGSYSFNNCTKLVYAVFAGNAPGSLGSSVFSGAGSGFAVYFGDGSSGFTTPTWQGYPAGAIPPPPDPVTGGATNITDTGATLDGVVNPEGFHTLVSFEYGADSSYGNRIAATLSPANGTAAQAVAATLGGLEAGQTYHYRLTATNAGGTGVGEDHTFVTERTLGDYRFTVADSGATITGYAGPGGAAQIPATLDEVPVTAIAAAAFQGNATLTAMTIPDSVTSIGDAAFSGCTGLTSVTIGSSVATIGDYAFYGCTGLADITIPGSVTSIGSSSFNNCAKLVFAVFAGDAPGSFGSSVFSGTGSGFAVYFGEGSSGFTTPTWQGYPAGAIPPPPEPVTGGTSGITATGATLGGVVNPQGFHTLVRFEYGTDTSYGNRIAATLSPANGTTAQAVAATLNGLEAGQIYHYRFTATNAGGTGVGEDHTFVTERTLGDYKFTVADSVVTITGYVGLGGTALIPATLDGMPVVGIRAATFINCTGLTEVTIPDSVTSIGDSAFSGCTGLTSIGIPGNVTSIGYGIFFNCTGLTGITIPASVTSIGTSAFSGCKGLMGVSIGNGVTTIGNSAFRDCTGLTEVTIPDSVTSIGDWAFSGCTGLTGIAIPDSVTTIGDWAFSGCTKLTSISIPGNVASIGYGTFSNCTGLTGIIIPDSVTSIGDWSFYDCSGLTSVTIPPSVTSIGDGAFSLCSELTSVTIGSGVTAIGSSSFTNCSKLVFAVFAGDAPHSFGLSVFSGTGSGFAVYFGDGSSGFTTPTWQGYPAVGAIPAPPEPVTGGASGITADAATIGGVVNPGGFFTLARFEYGTDSSYAGSTVVNLPFPDGTTAQSVNVTLSGLQAGQTYHYRFTATNAGGTGVGEDHTFATERTLGDYKFTVADSGATITGYVGLGGAAEIPATLGGVAVAVIGSGAFHGKATLTTVTIPESVKDIGNHAFSGCTGLTSITIPDLVTRIGDGAFSGCADLASVHLPLNLASIGNSAFRSCSSLGGVTLPETVASIGDHAFSECASLGGIVIPDSAASIGAGAFSFCTNLGSVTLPAGILGIPDDAFYNCSSLAEVVIPSGVASIGSYAFSQCSGLQHVTIPDTVISVGNHAFSHCTSLGIVTLPDQVTSIGSYSFYGCTNLASAGIGAGVTSIGGSAFAACSSLESVTIPATVAAIGNFAFWYCGSLTSITVDALNATYASEDGVLFDRDRKTLIQCPGGKAGHYTIPTGVTSIGSYAFHNCAKLESVTIPNTVASIGNSAFYYCTDLAGVYACGRAPLLGLSAFTGSTGTTVYYLEGTAGWGVTYGGRPTAILAVPAVAAWELAPPGFTLAGATRVFTVRPSVPWRRYQVQESESMAAGTWRTIGPEYVGDGGDMVISHPHDPGQPKRFFRLALDPVQTP